MHECIRYDLLCVYNRFFYVDVSVMICYVFIIDSFMFIPVIYIYVYKIPVYMLIRIYR